MKVIKKILTILILICNMIIRRKHYTLKFVAEREGELKRWYYHFPLWGFEHGNLEMVAGADSLCELYADGKDEAVVEIYVSKKPCNSYSYLLYDHYIGGNLLSMNFNNGFIKGILDHYGFGRTYKHEDNKQTFWICPVTLFVLGRYPNHIYIKK